MCDVSWTTRLPRFDGVLRFDEEAIRRAAVDFGHLVSGRPVAVLEPGSVRDIQELIAFAAGLGIPVAARGGGHSLYGQGQAAGGIVLDMGDLNRVNLLSPDRAVVEAGARWSDVVTAVLPHRLVPPVLTDHLGTSVGGTLSVGGIGGMSHVNGLQTDHVTELDVVTGTGDVLTCSPTENPDLFDAVRAGLSQCAVILRATLDLVPAPARARYYRVPYDDLSTFLADQRKLVGDPRCDHLEGRVLAGPRGNWTYRLDAAIYYSPPDQPHPRALLRDLGRSPSTQIEDMRFPDFLHRGDPGVATLRSSGEWHHPHPWLSLFVPDTAVQSLVEEVLATLSEAGLGASGLILLYPVSTTGLRTPLLRRPEGPVIFQFCVLRTAPAGDPAVRDAMVAANHAVYQRAVACGSIAYPVNALPMSHDDWRAHFGPLSWNRLRQAASRYDPHGILTPGQCLPR